MSIEKRKKDISWLQLSDLHIRESTDWNMMIKSYSKLAERIHPSFIVVTGDYLNYKENEPKNYDKAFDFICHIGGNI